jgi:hypothetical protein
VLPAGSIPVSAEHPRNAGQACPTSRACRRFTSTNPPPTGRCRARGLFRRTGSRSRSLARATANRSSRDTTPERAVCANCPTARSRSGEVLPVDIADGHTGHHVRRARHARERSLAMVAGRTRCILSLWTVEDALGTHLVALGEALRRSAAGRRADGVDGTCPRSGSRRARTGLPSIGATWWNCFRNSSGNREIIARFTRSGGALMISARVWPTLFRLAARGTRACLRRAETPCSLLVGVGVCG